METIEVKNFLIIDKSYLEIKRINILIGPQASGKSIIAKLVYFFKSFLGDDFLRSIKENEKKTDLSKTAKTKFEQIFPPYAWERQTFEIIYRYDDYEVSISNKGMYSTFKIDYSKNLQSIHRKAKNTINKLLKEDISEDIEFGSTLGSSNLRNKRTIARNVFSSLKLDKEPFSSSIFIPAGRAYFSLLQKNIFAFLKQHGSVDPLFADFGSFYEFAKDISTRHVMQRHFNDLFKKKSKQRTKFIDDLCYSILKGELVIDDDNEWIKNKNQVVNVGNSSSGQLEALPLIVTLNTWPILRAGSTGGIMFIEEPEAHLFPESQKNIVELIAATQNLFETSFFITTHSPYILTCLNTLIFAGQLSKGLRREEAIKIVPREYQLDDDEVSAYAIKAGSAVNIMDKELKQIDAEVIDETSEIIGKDFDRLLELM